MAVTAKSKILASDVKGAVKSFSVSGKTVTFTKLDGTTGTFTTQDTNTTYSAATSSALGLVKIGSNISVSSGTISLSKANVTSALGFTPISSVSGSAIGTTPTVTTKDAPSTSWNGFGYITVPSGGVWIVNGVVEYTTSKSINEEQSYADITTGNMINRKSCICKNIKLCN